MRRLVILLLIGTLAACAGGRLKLGPTAGGEVVEAEGWSPVDAQDQLGTKKRSLTEAQKKAVEQVVGVYISAKTRVSQAVSVNQNILADVGGYIKKYEVVGEKEEGGFLKTRIRALVLYQKVGRDLDRLGLIRPDAPPGDPRVKVALAPGAAAGQAARAAAAVRQGLMKRGFSVVDGKEDSDIIVRGEAEAHPLRIDDISLGGFHSFRARVSLEAFKPEGGEVIAGKVQEASGLDPSAEIAEGKALETAGLMAAEALAEKLFDRLSRRVNVGLKVHGMADLSLVQRLVDDLRTQPDIALVTLSSYGSGAAELKVTTEGFAGDELAGMLSRMKRYKFTTKSVTPYRVEVRAGEYE